MLHLTLASSLPRPALPLVMALGLGFASQLIAQEVSISGATAAMENVIVSFAVPDSWPTAGTMVAREGRTASSVQVTAGKATMVVEHIEAGETLSYRFAPGSPPPEPYGVVTKTAGDRLCFSLWRDGRERRLFDYQMAPGPVPEGVHPVYQHGAHLHPLYSPSGRLVTGNHPADHRWHRGVWMAWTHTEFQGRTPDFWNMGKVNAKDKALGELLAEVRFGSLKQSWKGPVHGGFISEHRFIDHSSGKPVDALHETWQVTALSVGREATAMNVIDLVSSQRCAGPDAVKLPKYHYGGLGVRGNLAWDPVDAVRMLTSNGDDRKKGDSTKAKWVYLGGDLEGQATGLAVLIHPSNFRFPQPLRLNPKNPQLCVAPSQDGDWSIEPGSTYVSKYRLLVFDGEPDVARLEAAWLAYAQPLQVVVK